ncbi:hypothetical protein PITCH_A1290001 [uncultured Desulfobacterium sp.]|uniref:Teneurin-like YD-shell domain-containing protein n=1 Tax=uncultured Desulfobacterium sp. TaxID=201089 RepID=A0A445MS36_9BACT|nr:hypothetical protein PITCH_A1290001 [uncultured Desulfobacterium sp.]
MTTYGYTPSGKLETITYQDSSTVNFAYDVRDNLQSMQDSLGTTTYNLYDAANRLKTVTNPYGLVVSYNYDAAGNITDITYPGSKMVHYTYDQLNRLDTVTINWLSKTANYDYDQTGALSRVDNFNGTWTSFGYDNAGRLTDIQNRKTDLSVLATYHFTLDNNGNRTFIDQHEPLFPTLGANTTNYTYNAKKSRLLTAGGTSFSYDDEGQTINKGGTTYSFDYEHRLTGVGSSYSYFYDGMGNRLKAVRSGVETRYLYDPKGNLLAETDNNDVITKYYIHGQGLLAMVTASGQIYCYHFNATGSTIAMTDSSQNVVNSYAYTPFGEIASQQETVAQPFKYVGQHGVMAEPNGLLYMRNRYYDSSTGRFISEDPSGFGGGDVNLYVYCNNNPVLLVDPTGLFNSETFFNGFSKFAQGTAGIAGSAALLTITDGAAWPIAVPAIFVSTSQASEGISGMIAGAISSTPVTIPNTSLTYNVTLLATADRNQATFNDSAVGLGVNTIKPHRTFVWVPPICCGRIIVFLTGMS